MDVVKPILKWVGGKTQILDKIISSFPSHINNYHEPFVGGGSVLFALLSLVYEGSIKVDGDIYASDKNANLIYMYKNIQERPSELIEALDDLVGTFKTLKFEKPNPNRKPNTKEEALECQECYYYWIRKVFNGFSNIERMQCKASAYFIFLTKHVLEVYIERDLMDSMFLLDIIKIPAYMMKITYSLYQCYYRM